MQSKPIRRGLSPASPQPHVASVPRLLGTEVAPERLAETTFEPLYQVLVHNDDVTPYEYVLQLLVRVFLLSEELAEHVAWTAHSEGQAVVLVRPRAEAERLVTVAISRARMDNYPLGFSVEVER